jgi:hypothetical protein
MTTTTTEMPVTIRLRGRTRLNGRIDSPIQTQSHKSQDEYVRFSPVNQNSAKASSRPRVRSRTRAQQIQHRNSPIQTDGQEYVRIQSVSSQQRKSAGSTTTQSTKSANEYVSEGKHTSIFVFQFTAVAS